MPNPTDPMTHRYHSVSRSLGISAGCIGLRWVVDVDALVRPRDAKRSAPLRRMKRASCPRPALASSPKPISRRPVSLRRDPSQAPARRGELNAPVWVLPSAWPIWNAESVAALLLPPDKAKALSDSFSVAAPVSCETPARPATTLGLHPLSQRVRAGGAKLYQPPLSVILISGYYLCRGRSWHCRVA
jgi:hypothetical protein